MDYFPQGVSGFPLMHQNCADLATKISEIVLEDGTIQFCSLVDYIYMCMKCRSNFRALDVFFFSKIKIKICFQFFF